jgi:hypothetical protein
MTPRLNPSKIRNSTDEKCLVAWRQLLTGLEFGIWNLEPSRGGWMTLHFLALQLGISLCRRSFPMAEGRHEAIPSSSAVDVSGWPHCGRSITAWGAAATLPPELSSSPRSASPILSSNRGSCAGKPERTKISIQDSAKPGGVWTAVHLVPALGIPGPWSITARSVVTPTAVFCLK